MNVFMKRFTALMAGLAIFLCGLITAGIPAQADETVPTLRRVDNAAGVVVGDGIDKVKVRTITFQNTKPTTGTCWAAGGGAGENNDSVIGCATTSKVNSTMYDVAYGADGTYPGFPDNSSNLFSDNVARGNHFLGLVSFANLDKIDTSNVKNMYNMFAACKSLVSLDVSNFDTSNVTNMGFMFSDCSKLTSLDVSNFDTSKVTYMCGVFKECASLTELDVSNFDTSNVTVISYMFYRCTSLEVLDISSFDTSRVLGGDTSGMLSSNPKLQRIRVGAKFIHRLGQASGLGEPDGDAARSGYVNIGRWRNMATGEVYDSPQSIPSRVAATYTPFKPIAYTVRFDANNGGGSMGNQSFTYDEAQDLMANALTRDGYTFTGWNTQADGKGASYTDKQSVKNLTTTNSGVVDLYAQWKANPTSITPGTGEDTTPVDAAPADTAPADAAPMGTAPADTTPMGTAPADTAPADTTPADTAPADAAPADTTTPATPLAQTGATANAVALIGALLVCLAVGLCFPARGKRHGE